MFAALGSQNSLKMLAKQDHRIVWCWQQQDHRQTSLNMTGSPRIRQNSLKALAAPVEQIVKMKVQAALGLQNNLKVLVTTGLQVESSHRIGIVAGSQ